MAQMFNNIPEQTLLGDLPSAVVDAVLARGDAHNEIKTQFLTDEAVKHGFVRLILNEILKAG